MSETDFSDAYRGALSECNVKLVRKLWNHLAPHMPQPKSDAEALATIHMARTECAALPLSQRQWSHRWLAERNLPSLLPDHMRPSAEQIVPKVVRAVGNSVNFKSALLKPVEAPVREAINYAILDIHADDPDFTDDVLVRRRMKEAKADTLKRLLGLRE